jgi:hypothetical protein
MRSKYTIFLLEIFQENYNFYKHHMDGRKEKGAYS